MTHTETAGGRPKRRSPRRIDWSRAAQMLVTGAEPVDIAAVLGITEEQVWRHLEGSEHFRLLIRQASLRRQLLAAASGFEQP